MPGTSQLSIPRTLFYPKNTLLSQEHSSIPRTLVLSGNLTANWEVFTRYWTHYKIASKLKTEEPEVRVATFLLCVGRYSMNTFNGFSLSGDESKNMDSILSEFEKLCIGETNEKYERFIFNSRNQ